MRTPHSAGREAIRHTVLAGLLLAGWAMAGGLAGEAPAPARKAPGRSAAMAARFQPELRIFFLNPWAPWMPPSELARERVAVVYVNPTGRTLRFLDDPAEPLAILTPLDETGRVIGRPQDLPGPMKPYAYRELAPGEARGRIVRLEQLIPEDADFFAPAKAERARTIHLFHRPTEVGENIFRGAIRSNGLPLEAFTGAWNVRELPDELAPDHAAGLRVRVLPLGDPWTWAHLDREAFRQAEVVLMLLNDTAAPMDIPQGSLDEPHLAYDTDWRTASGPVRADPLPITGHNDRPPRVLAPGEIVGRVTPLRDVTTYPPEGARGLVLRYKSTGIRSNTLPLTPAADMPVALRADAPATASFGDPGEPGEERIAYEPFFERLRKIEPNAGRPVVLLAHPHPPISGIWLFLYYANGDARLFVEEPDDPRTPGRRSFGAGLPSFVVMRDLPRAWRARAREIALNAERWKKNIRADVVLNAVGEGGGPGGTLYRLDLHRPDGGVSTVGVGERPAPDAPEEHEVVMGLKDEIARFVADWRAGTPRTE